MSSPLLREIEAVHVSGQGFRSQVKEVAIAIGSRIGSYDVTGTLGAGGMGEVYRAHDTKLQREVALKVLPDAFALDLDRIARFQREAQVLASLNHPNIAGIHGLEESNGVHALVLELVDGPTLADQLVHGPIPLDEALPIARQIADALEAAHEHGVIHRDLKPANIKVRTDGTVKVLDFGLAKLAGPAKTGHDSPDVSPTITTPAMTGVGMILGTAAYMSPEQAKGREADKRSDVWAFGCVLFEMLTGTRAFAANDVAETLAVVLTKEPAWSALPHTTPLSIARLLRRTLQKDRRRRLSDIADARLEIDDTNIEEPVAANVSPARASVRERLSWAVAVVLALAVAGLAFQVLTTPAAERPPETRVDIVTPSSADSLSFALSPDGRLLAFAGESDGNSRLWLRSFDQGAAARMLPGTEGASLPFWAPDSRSIGFFAGGKLKRVDVSGGMPRTLADAAPGFGGAWNDEGIILFAATSTTALRRISANGGEVVPQTGLDPPRQVSHAFPTFLPGGREFLFFARGTNEGQGIYVGSFDSPGITRLVAADRPPMAIVSTGRSAATFTSSFRPPDSWLLFVRQGTVIAQRLDHANKRLSGEPTSIADSVVLSGGSSAAYAPAAFSATPSGIVAYRTGAIQSQLTWFGRTGEALGAFGARDAMSPYNPEMSPDGRLVALRRTAEENTDIFVMDGARTVRRTFDAAIEQYPVWSPDGSWLAFSSTRRGVGNLYRRRANGIGGDELLFETKFQKNVDDWSPDGRLLLYNEEDSVTGRDLWVLPLDGDRKPSIFLKTNSQEHRGQFSPNGKFVAYVSNESGQHEIFVRPFPASDNQWQISTSGGVQPRWSHDGKEIYYIAPDGKLMATPIVAKDGVIEPGTPVALFQTSILGGGTNAYTKPQYDVSSDGRFLINQAVDDAARSAITLLLNWKPPTK